MKPTEAHPHPAPLSPAAVEDAASAIADPHRRGAPPPTPRLRRVCSWCSTVMDEGDPGQPTAHGACPICVDQVRKQMRVLRGALEAGGMGRTIVGEAPLAIPVSSSEVMP